MMPAPHTTGMLAPPTRRRSRVHLLGAGLVCLLLCAAGCKTKGLGGQLLGSGFHRPHSKGILTVLWRRHVNPDHQHKILTWKLSPEEHATPVDDADLGQVCVGSERQIFSCFDAKTGKLKWSRKTRGRIAAQAIIHGDLLYVGTTSGLMMAFNRSNGKPGWKKPYQCDGEILSKATVAKFDKGQDLLLFSASNNKVFALNAVNGKWAWLYRRDPPDRLSMRGQAPPLFYEGIAYAGFSDGSVVAIDASNGTKKWERSLKENERFPDVDAGLVMAEDTLYASSYSGSMHALKPKTGKIIWKRRMVGAARPVVSDGHMFVATSDGRINKYNAENGKPLWKQPIKFKKAGSFTDLIADDYYIYASSSERGIYVLHRDNGRLMQVLRFGSGFAPPVRHETQLFALSFSSFLYALSSKQNSYIQR